MSYSDITVTLPKDEVAKLEATFGPMSKEFTTICEKAVAAGTRAMRNAMARYVEKDYGIPRKKARERAWAGQSKNNPLVGIATAGRWGWSLASLGYDDNAYEVEGHGVLVTLPGGRAIRYAHAFALRGAQGRHGGTLDGIFERVPGFSRLPIERAYIASTSEYIRQIAAQPEIERVGVAAAMRAMARERDKLLTGGKN